MGIKKRTFYPRLSLFRVGLFVSLPLFLLPNPKLNHPRVRNITKALKISTAKKTPPRVAFEEVLNARDKKSKAPASQSLVPQPSSLNQVIARGQLRPMRKTLHYRTLDLPTMVIARNSRSNHGDFDPIVASAPPEPSRWVDTLTPRQRRLVEASGLSTDELDKVPEQPSLAEALAKKVEEELFYLRQGQGTATASGPQVIRASSSQPKRGSNEKRNTSNGPYPVQGIIHLSDATPFLPDYRFEVHWLREGQSRASGRIQLHDAKFFIEVPELIGQVRVEMLDSAGQLVAESSQRLSPELSTSVLTQLHLKMRPVTQVAAYYTDFYDDPMGLYQGQAVPRHLTAKQSQDVKTQTSFDEETIFEPSPSGELRIEGMASSSTSLAVAESDVFYPALHFLKAGENGALPMIPKKTVSALFSIVEEQQAFTSVQRNGSLVLGRLTSNGKSMSGGQVEIIGFPNLKPIYLNEILLPDPKLTETTSSGYFAFVHLPPDFYSIQAKHAGQFVGAANVVSEVDAASFVHLQAIEKKAPFEIRTFDAFTGEAVATRLDFQVLGQSLNVEGYGVIDHPVLSELTLVDSTPSTDVYVPSVYSYFADQTHLHLPVVKRAWLNEIMARERVNLAPESGAILGFSEKGGYEISLPHMSQMEGIQILYFDAEGRVVPAAIDQGGFLIVNLPPSAQTVVLKRPFGERVSQVLPVDLGNLTTSRFVF